MQVLASLWLGDRDEHVSRQMALLKFQKGRTRAGGRQTAHVALSNLRVTRGGKVFGGLGAYVLVLKGRKWAKRLNWRGGRGFGWKGISFVRLCGD